MLLLGACRFGPGSLRSSPSFDNFQTAQTAWPMVRVRLCVPDFATALPQKRRQQQARESARIDFQRSPPDPVGDRPLQS
jgi:hypothetical protein